MGGIGLIFWIALALLLVLVAAGAAYQAHGLAVDARRYPAPGWMIDGFHVSVAGSGMPPVVLEAGIGATSLSWGLIESEIAKTAQVISYDRAGLGWSDTIDTSREICTLVDEMRTVLDKVRIGNPRVVVGHSFGGLIALAYAARFPEEVAGMVLIDPPGIEEWAQASPAHLSRLRRGVFGARLGGCLARIGLVRFTLNSLSGGARRMPQMIARATSGGAGLGFIERMVGQIRKLPPESWPRIQAHWSDPKCFRAIARQLEALPECAAWLAKNLGKIGAPFILLSAGDASPTQRAEHENLVKRSQQGRLEIVEGSGHWVQLDRPDVVLSAVREVVARRLESDHLESYRPKI